jgi:hypothetical protein
VSTNTAFGTMVKCALCSRRMMVIAGAAQAFGRRLEAAYDAAPFCLVRNAARSVA